MSARVFIAGLGQIGGSLATDLIGSDLVEQLIGFDTDKSVRHRAREKRIVHHTVDSIEAGIGQADIIILAAPIRACIALMAEIGRLVPSDWDGVVFDVASTKVPILRAATEAQLAASYIGGHPMTGTEKQGLEAAGAGRFAAKTFVVAPSPAADDSKTDIVLELVAGIGAEALIMTAEDHDRLVALTSHLPCTVALALMQLAASKGEVDDRIWQLTAGSFNGATRVAGSPVDLTVDMLLTNREEIRLVLDDLIAELSTLRNLVETGDEAALTEIAGRIHALRQD